MGDTGFKLLNFRSPKIRTLHFTWLAFFLTFVVWFNHAPLSGVISKAFDLTPLQWKALLVLNVALTIPSRIVIGMLVDKFGPRAMFSILLMVAGVLCTFFALAQTFEQLALARFLMGFIGAGFVVGIRLVGEWFPAKEVGMAAGGVLGRRWRQCRCRLWFYGSVARTPGDMRCWPAVRWRLFTALFFILR